MKLFLIMFLTSTALCSVSWAKKESVFPEIQVELKNGQPIRLARTEAHKLCISKNAHLPTAREWAQLATDYMGAKGILEVQDVKGSAPQAYHLIKLLNADGTQDSFYYNATFDGQHFEILVKSNIDGEVTVGDSIVWLASDTTYGTPMLAWGASIGKAINASRNNNGVVCIPN